QRVYPEVAVPPAVAAAAAALLQDQLADLRAVGKHRAPARGRRPAPVGIQDAQPQRPVARRPAAAGGVPVERVAHPVTVFLVLAAQPHVDSELETVRVGAD